MEREKGWNERWILHIPYSPSPFPTITNRKTGSQTTTEHRTQRRPGHTAEPWGSLVVAWATGMSEELNKEETCLSRPFSTPLTISHPSPFPYHPSHCVHRPPPHHVIPFPTNRPRPDTANQTANYQKNRQKQKEHISNFLPCHFCFYRGMDSCGVLGVLWPCMCIGHRSGSAHHEERHEKRM